MQTGADKNQIISDYTAFLKALLPETAGFCCHDRRGRLFWEEQGATSREWPEQYQAILHDILETPGKASEIGRISAEPRSVYILTLTDNEQKLIGALSVFVDPLKRHQLESILHPLIKTQVHNRMAGLTSPYCVIVVPLLIESAWQDLVDRILVIDTPEDLQISRVAARDGLSETQIRRIMQSQVDRPTRLAAADDIIVNDDDIVNLENDVDKLHEKYLRFALQLK